jgi:hypothetical protein
VLVLLVLLVVLRGAIAIDIRGAARPALFVIFSRQGIAARQVHCSRSRYLSRTFRSCSRTGRVFMNFKIRTGI